MKKIITGFLLAVMAFGFFGCDEENVETMVYFYTCEARNELGVSRQKVVMPESGFEVIANKKEFMTSADMQRVDVAQVQMPDGKLITGFLFTCNEKGQKKLYRETAANIGGWILMKENSNSVALRKIDTIIQDGKLFMVLEFPADTDLFMKAAEYNKDINIIAPRVRAKEENLW